MKKIFKISVVSTLIFSGFLLVATAQQAVGPRGSDDSQKQTITFPVEELGSCASATECRAYCNKPENMEACTNFATLHGLISQAQRQQNQKFAQAIKAEKTPGGCKTADACKAYCAQANHNEECVAFAQSHNLGEKENLDQSKKVNDVIKSGGGPGGCKSLGECKQFCSIKDNAQTCLDFAKKNSLVKEQEGLKIQKFNELVKAGQTPGACSTKDACEEYCKDATHKQECVDFAAKLGVINKDQSEKIKKITQGPGGCTTKDACEAYCNDQTHHDECIKFAQDNGLIKPEDAKNLQATIDSLQKGIAKAPEPVKICIKEQLGTDAYSQIMQGKFTPTPEAGKKIKACFEKFKPQEDNKKETPAAIPSPRSEEMKKCVLKKLGIEQEGDLTEVKIDTSAPEVQDAFKACQQELGPSTQTPPSQGMGDPGKVRECVQNKLGDKFELLANGKISKDDPDVQSAMKACGYGIMPTRPTSTSPSQPQLPPPPLPPKQ